MNVKTRNTNRELLRIYDIGTEKSFRNLVDPNRKSDYIYHFRLIWNQTEFCLVPNQSENNKYNLIFGLNQQDSEKFSVCVAALRVSLEPCIMIMEDGSSLHLVVLRSASL